MSLVPTFATPPGFLGLPQSTAPGEISIAGIPLDIGVTNRAGTREGPAAIRRASRMLVDGSHPATQIDPRALPLADVGDFALALGDLTASLALIEQQAAAHPHLVALGGEHGISLPLLRALSRRLGRPLALVHFDAHLDTWPESFGQRFSHGQPFFHAIEEGLVDPKRMIQIGIRSPVEPEVMAWTLSRGVTVISALDVHEAGPAAVAARVAEVVGTAPAYLSLLTLSLTSTPICPLNLNLNPDPSLQTKPIPHPPHREEVNRVWRIRFEVLAESENEVVDCPGAGVYVVAPHFFKDVLPRDHFTGAGS